MSRLPSGCGPGEAHIIRNAGGLATEDVIRSLIVSQQLLGTDEIVVIGHTGCGLLNADEDALRDRLTAATGEALDIGFGSFDDLEASIRASVERLRTHPWLERVPVHGLAFDVATGRVEVVALVLGGEVLAQPGEDVGVGGGRLGRVVATTGVVEEGVIDARVGLHLVGQPGGLERRGRGLEARVDASVELGVDAEDRGLVAAKSGADGAGP